MGLAHRKLERFTHLYDRFSEIVKFETFAVADVKQIVDELSGIPLIAGAVELLHQKHNRFRQIIQAINQFETVAKENNLSEIDEKIMRQLI